MSDAKPNTAPDLATLTQHFGIILGTERFDDCVTFYRDILGLPLWFEKDGLCCLRFGAGYLMIETGGHARDTRKPNSENPTMLRFNVKGVPALAETLRARGGAPSAPSPTPTATPARSKTPMIRFFWVPNDADPAAVFFFCK